MNYANHILSQTIKVDTQVMQYISEHPSEHNIITGIDLITREGINAETKLGEYE